MLEIIASLLKLITPDPNMKDVRLGRKELRFELKQLRVAERMYKDIRKEFRRDGLSSEEKNELRKLRIAIKKRKIDLITE